MNWMFKDEFEGGGEKDEDRVWGGGDGRVYLNHFAGCFAFALNAISVSLQKLLLFSSNQYISNERQQLKKDALWR